MKVLVTGSNGFISKNLIARLKELKKYEIIEVNSSTKNEDLKNAVLEAQFIFHLAGVNRPPDEKAFNETNVGLTQIILEFLKINNLNTPIVFSSSIQAELMNPYGISKKAAEEILLKNKNALIYRLPNVFGKWSRPNYNSAVATFCYNVINDLPVKINDENAIVNLVYIDDVVDSFVQQLSLFELNQLILNSFVSIEPVYHITVGELYKQIKNFKDSRLSLITESVGVGLVRALYSTYLSFIPPKQFNYTVPRHEDSRGVFVEMLKTKDSGQFSFFTAKPGITRGGHYHHTKTEKFLVIKGKALYRFLNILTQETYEIIVDSLTESTIIETVPGWSHDITNIGEDELVVMLWANEIFDREKPDTYAHGTKL